MLRLYEVRRSIASLLDTLCGGRFPAVWRWLRWTYWEAFRWRHPFVEVAGVRVRVARVLAIPVRRVLYEQLYEPLELEILRSTLELQDVVMELGTGLGVVATYAAGRIGSDHVFTYEANPALAPLARDTFELNQVAPAFETCLLGEASGETTFYVAADFRASSTIPSDISNPRSIRVPVRSLNDELRRIRPTFMIVDIEGGEHDLIQQMNLAGIRKILIEVHENVIGAAKVDRLKSIMLDAGFTIDRHISAPTCWFLTRAVAAES